MNFDGSCLRINSAALNFNYASNLLHLDLGSELYQKQCNDLSGSNSQLLSSKSIKIVSFQCRALEVIEALCIDFQLAVAQHHFYSSRCGPILASWSGSNDSK